MQRKENTIFTKQQPDSIARGVAMNNNKLPQPRYNSKDPRLRRRNRAGIKPRNPENIKDGRVLQNEKGVPKPQSLSTGRTGATYNQQSPLTSPTFPPESSFRSSRINKPSNSIRSRQPIHGKVGTGGRQNLFIKRPTHRSKSKKVPPTKPAITAQSIRENTNELNEAEIDELFNDNAEPKESDRAENDKFTTNIVANDGLIARNESIITNESKGPPNQADSDQSTITNENKGLPAQIHSSESIITNENRRPQNQRDGNKATTEKSGNNSNSQPLPSLEQEFSSSDSDGSSSDIEDLEESDPELGFSKHGVETFAPKMPSTDPLFVRISDEDSAEKSSATINKDIGVAPPISGLSFHKSLLKKTDQSDAEKKPVSKIQSTETDANNVNQSNSDSDDIIILGETRLRKKKKKETSPQAQNKPKKQLRRESPFQNNKKTSDEDGNYDFDNIALSQLGKKRTKNKPKVVKNNKSKLVKRRPKAKQNRPANMRNFEEIWRSLKLNEKRQQKIEDEDDDSDSWVPYPKIYRYKLSFSDEDNDDKDKYFMEEDKDDEESDSGESEDETSLLSMINSTSPKSNRPRLDKGHIT
ncbi:hypothetical protein DASC09_033840 [Saccharomycopsis crataegensis]|uniref:Uncharacterized protein n=1 Tax=Saccharomycopsis crataegensis TaxID=43959 RepID=A0AAV5QNM8_9ASCO|nr:hypothetical protein DASC09_033840 [Saccharomycopsis crataegensis]